MDGLIEGWGELANPKHRGIEGWLCWGSFLTPTYGPANDLRMPLYVIVYASSVITYEVYTIADALLTIAIWEKAMVNSLFTTACSE
uniref:Uncharacterized protein n=1 Tax=Candidatus Kentrum sp. LFY TaxID=2126342 RepID=A0A450V5N4_9GAMM|nr:MAG: hypothetical protein BECKLFY1418B_GA0070995_11711 [Candidatus Kentron sp. LFY]